LTRLESQLLWLEAKLILKLPGLTGSYWNEK
jgi:hypothetical protein